MHCWKNYSSTIQRYIINGFTNTAEPRATASNSVHDQNAVLLCFHYCNLLQCRCSGQLLRNPPVRLGPVATVCCICNASAHNMSLYILLSGGPCCQYPFLTYSEDYWWLDHPSVNSGNHRWAANGMSKHPLLPIRRLIQAKKMLVLIVVLNWRRLQIWGWKKIRFLHHEIFIIQIFNSHLKS